MILKYTEVIKEKGFKVHPINEISYLHYREHVDNNNNKHYSPSLVRHFVDMELDLMQKVKPDIVIGHNRQTLYISTKLAQIKYIALTVASIGKHYNYKYFVPENHFLSRLISPIIDINKILPSFICSLK